MSTAIVNLTVSVVTASAPSQQQRKGAFISQGATTLTAGTTQRLSSASDLAGILAGSHSLTTITWASSTATATAAAAHGIPTGQTVQVTIMGVVPAGYNGTFAATSTGTTTFTYPLASNPGTQTTAGSYTLEDVAELVAMNTTFWANGSQTPVTVLELGTGDPAHGVTALSTYITSNSINGIGPFYSYLVPRTWAAETTFATFLGSYETPASKTYFFITATNSTYTNFTAAMKCAVVWIEAPSIPATEFSLAAMFQDTLNYQPSATNKVTPQRYTFLFGVTPYPQQGNQTLINTYLAANVNLALTGAEGGLSNIINRNGTTMDGNDFSYWYSVDWVQYNVDLNVSAAVINGSNNSANPLYYNQDGINRLQAVINTTMSQGVTYGMVLGAPIQVTLDPGTFNENLDDGDYNGQTPINAYPFIAYSVANPNDFAQGVYNGFAIAFTPNRGFATIGIALVVNNLVAA